jgi:hypothetical protein
VIVPGTTNQPTNILGSYPLATVTLYQTGTSTAITGLWSNNSGTALSNPFSCDSTGWTYFYAPAGRYDATFSGTGITSPFTISDILVYDPIGPNADGPLQVATFATGGSGTSSSPYTGWESGIAAVPCGGTAHFKAAYYSTSQNFSFGAGCPTYIEGEGQGNTFLTGTGIGTPFISWIGSTTGGGLKQISIKVTTNSVDAVSLTNINQFVMREVVLTGNYSGSSGNAIGCVADNESGCGLHISGGSVYSLQNVYALFFAGDGVNLNVETAGDIVMRTVYGQGDGGWNIDIHRTDNASTGGPVYGFDVEALGVPGYATAGGFNISSTTAVNNQLFGFWCFECISDGMTTPTTAMGVAMSGVSYVFWTHAWIKSLATGAAAISMQNVTNSTFEGGFIQNASSTLAPIFWGNAVGNVKLIGTNVTSSGSTYGIHWTGNPVGAGNYIEGSSLGTATVWIDDFSDSGLMVGPWPNGTTGNTTFSTTAAFQALTSTGITVGTGNNLSFLAITNAGTITPSSVGANGCSDQTFSLSAITTSMRVWVQFPAGVTTNTLIGGAWPTGSGTVNIHFCNPTGGSLTPPSGQYEFFLIQSSSGA